MKIDQPGFEATYGIYRKILSDGAAIISSVIVGVGCRHNALVKFEWCKNITVLLGHDRKNLNISFSNAKVKHDWARERER